MKQPEIYPELVQKFLESFRRSYSTKDVIKYLEKLKNLRVLIVGETILDEYYHVAVIGKPPKGTHIAVRYLGQEVHAGGVLACANHLAGFCGEVDLLTIIGRNDDSENFVKTKLKSNIYPKFFYQNKAIIKRRFVDHAYSNKVFEVYENEEPHSDDTSESISDWIEANFLESTKRYDLVLVLDYGHNLFSKDLIERICKLPCFLAVNAQTNTSNFGYNLITKYPRANYFCLDEWELRLAYQDRQGDIEPMICTLGQRISLPGTVSVTRGHLGAISYDLKTGQLFQAPAFSQKIVDTTGAGDAFLAITAPCVAKGFPTDLVVFIGNAVGALAVEYLGNRSSIEADALYQFIETLLKQEDHNVL